MKKFLLLLALCLPLTTQAKEKRDDSPYMKGAVPEINGIVTFSKAFKVPGKSKQQIYSVLKPWITNLVDSSIEAPGQYARTTMDTQDTIVAKVCEWQIYKQKVLNLDRSRFRYTLAVIIEDGRVQLKQTNLSYYYGEDMEGNKGQIYRAEEWITDSRSLNKAQTKLLPQSGKFRRKTVDRAKELFEQAMDAFDQKEAPAAPVVKVRKGVVEE